MTKNKMEIIFGSVFFNGVKYVLTENPHKVDTHYEASAIGIGTDKKATILWSITEDYNNAEIKAKELSEKIGNNLNSKYQSELREVSKFLDNEDNTCNWEFPTSII